MGRAASAARRQVPCVVISTGSKGADMAELKSLYDDGLPRLVETAGRSASRGGAMARTTPGSGKSGGGDRRLGQIGQAGAAEPDPTDHPASPQARALAGERSAPRLGGIDRGRQGRDRGFAGGQSEPENRAGPRCRAADAARYRSRGQGPRALPRRSMPQRWRRCGLPPTPRSRCSATGSRRSRASSDE